MAISIMGIMVLLVVASFAFAYLILIGVLLWHKRWGVATAAVGLPILLLGALSVSYRQAALPQPAVIDSLSTTGPATRQVRHTTPEVVSSEELEAIAAAEPRIELDDEASEESLDLPELDELAETDDLPAWVNEPLGSTEPDEEGLLHVFRAGSHEEVLTSGPFTLADSCRRDAKRRVREWLERVVRQEGLGGSGVELLEDALRREEADPYERFVLNTHLSEIDSSVGTVYVQYTRVAIEPGWLDSQIGRVVAGQRAMRVATGGGVVVALVGLVHLALRKPKA